jgi:tetratricopeptide (TPR) repeat protein
VLVAFVFGAAASLGFLKWDDQLYVTANPHIVGGLTWSNIAWALTSTSLPYWHPVTRLSHLVDVQIFGMNAAGPHVVNVAIHLVNTLLVWALFATLTRARWASLVVAAVFAVHPLHVESVAWIAERKDVLSTAFALLALLAYVAYVRQRTWRRYATVVALVALALMAKPMVVTLPLVMLLLDVWPLHRTTITNTDDAVSWLNLLKEKAPLIALSLGVAAATVVAQRGTGAMQSLSTLPWTARVGDAIQSYVAYIGQAIWPTRLSAFYPRDWSPSIARIAADVAVMAVATGVVVARRARQPYLLVGWLWFVIGLAPVVGLLQSGEQAMADRFMYVPLIGLTVMVVWSVAELSAAWPARSIVTATAALAVVATCAVLARQQVGVWRNDVTLWQHAVAVTDRNYVAENLLGLALQEHSDTGHAIESYHASLADAPAREPDFVALVHTNIGDVLARAGRPLDAIGEYQNALALNPKLADAQSDLGSTLVTVGRPADAVAHYQAALALKPGFAAAENGYGAALALLGRTNEAESHYRAAVESDPQLATAHTNLAMALATTGQTHDAVNELLVAIRLEPNHAAWEFNVGALLMRQGLPEEAAPHFTNALAIDPGFERAQKALETIAASAR